MSVDKHSVEKDEEKQHPQEEDTASSAELKQISEYEKEVTKLKDLFVRERADNENLRKRFKKELEDAHKFAITNFAKSLIEPLEDLFRALESVDKDILASNQELKILFEGVEMTKRNMLRSFEDFGIDRIYPLNEQFNHEYHQAISQVVDNDKTPNTIVKVIQAGYSIKGRLLRSAIVVVSKKEERN